MFKVNDKVFAVKGHGYPIACIPPGTKGIIKNIKGKGCYTLFLVEWENYYMSLNMFRGEIALFVEPTDVDFSNITH